jgi:hypothetical protein
MMKLVRSLSALVVGYAVIVLLTTFGFDAVHRLFAVHDTWGSPPPVIIAAAFVAVAAGLAGGFTASFIGYRRPLHSAALVVVPLLADSTYVLFFYHGHAPFWFGWPAASPSSPRHFVAAYSASSKLRGASPLRWFNSPGRSFVPSFSQNRVKLP